MEYTVLTGTGVTVSRVCLGTMTMGDQVDEKAGVEAVNYALDQGVNFLDTANMYTGGKSETIVGKAIAGKRDRFVLATKVGQKMRDGINGLGLSRHHIMKEMEDSLRRLGTDYVDFYYLHAPDRNTPLEETLSAMDALVKSGKVRYVGASNYSAWQMVQMKQVGETVGGTYPVVTQSVYNLITRGIEQELVPCLKEYKMGLVVYNPLAGGLLTEKYAAKAGIEDARLSRNKIYHNRYWNEDNLQAWDDINAIAKKAGISMVQLAMRWLYSTGNVDVIITGFSRMEQLKQNLASAEGGMLPAEVITACDEVWNRLSGTRFKYYR